MTGLAARQFGLIERGQAERLGVAVRALNERAKREGWERLHPGVLALPGAPDSPERRIRAATLATTNASWATRWTAAYLWGLADRLRVPVTIVVPHGHRAARLDNVKVVRSRTLEEQDTTTRSGIPVVTVERMIADLAGVTELPVLRALAIDARQRKLLRPPLLWELWERTWPVPGHQRLKRVAGDLQEPGVDSALEWRIRGLLRRAGVPDPFPEPYPVVADGRVVAKIDVAWPAWRVGVECDGFRYHSERAQLDRDSARQNRLVALGWRLVRVTWRQIDEDPQGLLDAIHKVRAEAGAL